MKQTSLFKRTMAFLLVICMLVSVPHVVGRVASADNSTNKVADPSTLDGWKSFFGKDVLNTFNAGGVWTDKSIFVSDENFAQYGISLDNKDGFLAALSLIASNKSVEGLSNMPTDTMIVLDLSSSMYPARNPETVNTMVSAVNSTVKKLQEMNSNNRVGVSIYFGGETLWESTTASSKVLLPLDRYTHAQNEFLKTTTQGGNYLVSIDVNSNVKNSASQTISGSHAVKDVAGTYAQLGILDAMDQFLRNDIDPVVPANASYQPGVERVPVLVLMSDGEPTAATPNYTIRENFKMGNNQIANRNSAETDFVTQLTAAYAKEKIDAKYKTTTPLFYTLSLGNSISMDIMNPEANDKWAADVLTNSSAYSAQDVQKAWSNFAIQNYWSTLLTNGKVNIKVQNYNYNSYSQKTEYTYTVSKTTLDSAGTVFPQKGTQRFYVDESFVASNKDSLMDAFDSIVDKIALQSKYFPTLVEGSEDLDGYVTITDNIGKYMSVSDIKGIIIGNVLFSGADLSSNFVEGGGLLGTYDNPSELGVEMVRAVMKRLGISDMGTAEAIIGQAYTEGQLSYTDKDNFSNYIGWYANAKGEFLGFWHEGITTMPSPDDESIEESKRPAYIVKSYGYLGALDEEHGIAESDMMYAMVQVRESIKTGEQTVTFSVPASLIPMVSYDISLDKNGNVSSFDVSGASGPMRLVYEVALNDNVTPITLSEVVDEEYLKANTNPDGSVNFYTNMYEVDNSMGYQTANAFSYFRPSHQNEKYYFQESDYVYVKNDNSYIKYVSENAPDVNGEYYYPVNVYYGGNDMFAKDVFVKLSTNALSVAEKMSNNEWHIPAGTVHVSVEDYVVYKESNPTDTLKDESGRGIASFPFVDIYGHKVNEANHSFTVGSTLGNNGRLTVTPATGIKISKSVEGVDSGDTEFAFNATSRGADGTFEGVKTDKNGNVSNVSVEFVNSVARFTLKAGESIIIAGLEAGTGYVVSEEETTEYKLVSVNGAKDVKNVTIITEANKIISADFINGTRGKGSLTVSKVVEHNLGVEYVIPADKSFEIVVTLSGVGSENAEFDVIHSGDNSLTKAKSNENGVFPAFVLKHNEQVEIKNIPEGVVATVVENNPPQGFTAEYRENGTMGDGIVEIKAAHTAVEVVNTYDHGKTTGNNVVIKGTKFLNDQEGNPVADWGNASFEIVLERYTNRGWTEVARKTVSNANRTFEFTLASEEYTMAGTYAYQLYEIVPSDENRIEGMFYDPVYHTFSVVVADEDMEGGLEITRVHSEHSGKEFEKDENGNWQVLPNFTNVQYNTAPAVVRIPVRKALINETGSNFVSLAHHEFGLFTNEDCTVIATTGNGISLIELAATDAVGEAELDVVFDKVGEYTLYLKEIDKKVPGMTYDDKVARIDVSVSLAGVGGKLKADVTYSEEFVNGGILFTNQYNLEKVTVDLDVRKELEGRDLTENDVFTFEILENGDTILEGKNDISGKVTFDGSLEFTKEGVYTYTVVETSKDGKGIVADKTVYHVQITVTDGGDGTLKAKVYVADVVGEVITFVNKYEAKAVDVVITGKKNLEGRPLINDEFTFVLAESNEKGEQIENAKEYLTKNFTDGHFAFETLTFAQEGEYWFTLCEKHESSVLGVEFDTGVYLVHVAVSDGGEGNMVALVTITKDGESVTKVEFNNKYVPASAHVFIPGTKLFEGKVLGEGDFEFVLNKADENWNDIEEIEKVKNNADGKFYFSDIEFKEAGSYFFTVKELFDANANNGIIYDASVYRIRIDVTDDHKGFLHSSVHFYDEVDVPQSVVLFVNRYEITGGAQVIIEGTKALIGKDLADGDFTFELKDKETGDATSVTNVGGKFEFILEYSPEDADKTFTYELYEVNGKKAGISYDESVYTVVVSVKDNGEGGIIAEKEITKENKACEKADFVNKYTSPEDISIKVEINKTVENTGSETIGADGFEFVLENVATGEKFTVISDKDGKGFFNLDFTSKDIGNTFNYKVYETNTGVENVIYSTEVYEISVKVSLAGNNTIDTEITVNRNVVTDAKCSFTNIYDYTPPAKPGDVGVSLYAVTLIISMAGLSLMLIKKRAEER